MIGGRLLQAPGMQDDRALVVDRFQGVEQFGRIVVAHRQRLDTASPPPRLIHRIDIGAVDRRQAQPGLDPGRDFVEPIPVARFDFMTDGVIIVRCMFCSNLCSRKITRLPGLA